MSRTGNARSAGLLGSLPNPAKSLNRAKSAAPVTISAEAEAALGLSSVAGAALAREATAPMQERAEPERSKTFFLPLPVCERLELQKLSERREMKHIVRQALEEYFDRNVLRDAVKDVFRS
jgi:hypothetical protein